MLSSRHMATGDDSSTLSVLRPAAPVSSCRPVEHFPPLYHVFRAVSGRLLRGLFDLRVHGIEHLPESGSFILAANHHNYLDGVVLGVAVPRPISFLVMPRVFRATPLHPPFHRRIGSIPVNLERPDPGAIKRVLRVLEAGRVVGIFPEGALTKDGDIAAFKSGVEKILERRPVPVVPMALKGMWASMWSRRDGRLGRMRVPRRFRAHVKVVAGEPMDGATATAESLEARVRALRGDAA